MDSSDLTECRSALALFLTLKKFLFECTFGVGMDWRILSRLRETFKGGKVT